MPNRGGFSWKRAVGISSAKSRISRTTGIPLTKSGRQRKVGRMVTGGGCLVPSVLALAIALLVAACGGRAAATGQPIPARTPVAATQPIASDPVTPEPVAVTLLDLTGSGIKNSKSFTTTGPWTVAYTYDCEGFGQAGTFGIYVYDDDGTLAGIAASEMGTKGASSSAVYETGTLHLTMNSTCDWHVTATQP